MLKEINWNPTFPRIINKSDDSLKNYGLNYDYDIVGISEKHIEDLKSGKCLAFDNGEHSIFIIFTPS